MHFLMLSDDLLLQIAVANYRMVVPLKKTSKKMQMLLRSVGLFMTSTTSVPKVMSSLTVYNGSGFWQEQNIYIVNNGLPRLFVHFFFVVTTNGRLLLSNTSITTDLFCVTTISCGSILFLWQEYDVYLHGVGSILRFTEEYRHKSKVYVLHALQTRMQTSSVACQDVPTF